MSFAILIAGWTLTFTYYRYKYINGLQVNGKVTHNLTLETAKRTSAVICEKEVFIALLDQAKVIFNLRSVTTDGNIMIRSYMRSEPDINHGLDIWHLCKNFRKNLVKKAKGVVSSLIHCWLEIGVLLFLYSQSS